MATAALPRSTARKPGARYDNYFFSGLAFLILITVFVGFARTYFLAGVFRAPLPNLLIQPGRLSLHESLRHSKASPHMVSCHTLWRGRFRRVRL
jgi:hypothetical protein